MAGLGPADVGVVQSYENFTGGVVVALARAEHRFFSPQEANDFLTLENLIAPSGRLPLNTSGGNLAGDATCHGFELVLEAVRQVRGTSTAQAARSDVALVIGGPMVAPASNLLLGSRDALENTAMTMPSSYLPPGLPTFRFPSRMASRRRTGTACARRAARAALRTLPGLAVRA